MRLVQFIFKTVAKLTTKAVFHWTLILIISVKLVFVDMTMSMDIVFISSNQNNFRYSRCIYNRQIKLWEKIKRLNLKDENTCWEKIIARLARGGNLEGGRLGTIRMMFSFHLISPHLSSSRSFAQKNAAGVDVFISVYYCNSNDGQE